MEASGLHDGSYPLQFGWCGLDLNSRSILVQPAPEWSAELFEEAAFDIHGISRERAINEGTPPIDVAHLLNGELEGKAVIADSPWDAYWTTRLADTVGVALRFGFKDFANVARELGSVSDPWCVSKYHRSLAALNQAFPHAHKADEDAQRLAALTRMIIDREWVEWLLDTNREFA